SMIAALAVLLGVAGFWVLLRALPVRSGIRRLFVLAPLAPLAIAALKSYSYSLARIFDWRENGRTFFSYLVLGLLFGLPAAAAVAFLVLLGRVYPLVPAIGAPLVFAAAFSAARSFAARTLERLGSRREYREELESALVHIDLSLGRDAVLGELEETLAGQLGFTDFAVLVEDDRGLLRTVHASTGGHASLPRGDELREHIERTGLAVIMHSEALAAPIHEVVRAPLLALFDSLKAEALIFAKEGRRIIGAFALGARKTGGNYTDYDYDTFRSICGKLFVFAFYLKNVARESILYTVDRELALSDQIIRFALEKVDKLDHPTVDAAWSMRSTRRLGGDFVDFVRMSTDRWFFVLGDVSGKGLSASMNMLVLKSMIRTFLRVEKDFTGLVQRVNLFVKENLPRGSFFAGVFGYFDLAKGAVYFINCGVPAILLYSPNFDAFVEVQGEGKVLGFVRDITPHLKPRKLSLPAGAALVVSTDGILDSPNIRGERFGKDRLRKAARDRLGKSAREIADGVLDDLLTFTDKRQEDDLTLLAMKFKERSAT
ncbi:MAG: serine/threonine-protein phosphatase, partial [Spirochaetaceae bacterium]|nr:serine/threonine-protein phosphatase [Spirochaetaceae bacterium]